MQKIETVEEFYKRKFDWMTYNIRNEIEHFNVFKLEPYIAGKPTHSILNFVYTKNKLP